MTLALALKVNDFVKFPTAANERDESTQPRSQGLSSLPPRDPGCGWSRDHPESGW